ncbi:MAG: hypothetical protein P4L87_19945 [Formivibrio sp.]|nr:hypothetical protein [Formivibrio sp.]
MIFDDRELIWQQGTEKADFISVGGDHLEHITCGNFFWGLVFGIPISLAMWVAIFLVITELRQPIDLRPIWAVLGSPFRN